MCVVHGAVHPNQDHDKGLGPGFWNLVFGLDRTATTGTADYQLRYQWHENQYIWSSSTDVKLVAGRCS